VKKYLEVSKTDKAKKTYLSARTLLNHFLKNIPETIAILQEYKTLIFTIWQTLLHCTQDLDLKKYLQKKNIGKSQKN
jgi:hypothetical protein